MRPPAWVSDYVGLPYREGEYDCWSLVRQVLAERAGIALPAFAATHYRRGCDRRALAREIAAYRDVLLSGAWHAVDVAQARALDVLWLRHGGDIHFAVVAAPGWMLHVEEGCETVLERYDGCEWRSRVLGAYRHG